jgi:hypothetical protein
MVPKNNPPSGRARKPTPKVAKLAIRAVAGSRLLKNSLEKISAEARPYRAKSKYSSALPAVLASVARRRLAAYSGSSKPPTGGVRGGFLRHEPSPLMNLWDLPGPQPNALSVSVC